MFEHSVKVPRLYKTAANIFKKASTEGASVKALLYNDKPSHPRTNAIFALITETIKHAADLDKIFENCSIIKNESRLDPWLAKILATELLFGKKALPGHSKPEQTVLSYKEQFEKYTSEHQDDFEPEAVRRPRYVRINTNLLTTSDAIGVFQEEGYRFIRCTSGSYDEYLKQIQALTEYDFTQDYHIKTIFVFSAGTKLHDHELYLENQIVLQDKATAMAVHLLAPPPGSVALDMCAAPGIKTTQLAAYMRNQGKIYAVERNEQRYQTLCDFVEKTGSKCVETLNKDSLEIKRGDFDDVEYILLDPSCSGSGMALRLHNYVEDTRLAKLTSLQEKFLKHAMNSFPKAKRIVYSTCSLFPEENERVVTNVVKTSRSKWRVQDVNEILKGQWNNFGSGMYGSMGTRCLYAKPDSDFTTGFFVAVIDRDPKYFERNLNVDVQEESNETSDVMNGEANDNNYKRKKTSELSSEENEIENHKVEREVPKKKKKKDQTPEVDDGNNTGNGDESTVKNKLKIKSEPTAEASEIEIEVPKKKKNKKNKVLQVDDVNTEGDSEEVPRVEEDIKIKSKPTAEASEIEIEAPKKKKKKKVKVLEVDNVNTEGDNEEVSTDVLETTVPKNKKKKDKRKSTEMETFNETEDFNATEIGIVKKTKKKKRKLEDDVFLLTDEVPTVDLTNESENKNKKHKKSKIDKKEFKMEAENVEEVIETPRKNKKKNHNKDKEI